MDRGSSQGRGTGRLRGLPAPPSAPQPRRGRPNVPAQLAGTNCILVGQRQRGNPLLSYITNLRYVYADVVPDYVVGEHHCALFISLRYHMLTPGYLAARMAELDGAFRLRVCLCLCDAEDPVPPLSSVTELCIQRGFSLVCCVSNEEAARYLETFKIYEKKGADPIKERVEEDYMSQVENFFTSVRTINKTDAHMLVQHFGTVAKVLQAEPEEWAAVPGIGPTKVRHLRQAFHEPFVKRAAAPADAAAEAEAFVATQGGGQARADARGAGSSDGAAAGAGSAAPGTGPL